MSIDSSSASSVVEARERDRRVANMMVQALMGSPAGRWLDRDRLLQVVEDQLPSLVRGASLSIESLVRALLRLHGVTEERLYLGILNLAALVRSEGLELEMPTLSLDEGTRARLVAEARAEQGRGRAKRVEELLGRIRRLRAQKLGDLLVAEGLIDRAQLAAALRAQSRSGGRLGTNLVESGHLSEVELAHFLSLQLGVPSVTRLGEIASEVIEVLPSGVAERLRVIPLRALEGEIHLAMADPLDLEAIDEVGRLTGLRVLPVVAPEILISYALERGYGIPRAPRVVGGTAPREMEVAFPEALTLDLPGLGARLLAAESPQDVLESLHAYLSEVSERASVWRVDGREATGWLLAGGAITLHRFRELRVELDDEPLWVQARDSHQMRSGLASAPAWVELFGPAEVEVWPLADASVPDEGNPPHLVVTHGHPHRREDRAFAIDMASEALAMVEHRTAILKRISGRRPARD